ncbi:nuclear transport factor 2 family protein [Phragmitibacter flavus]|uniref:Nuclear transport factor 2 family protein n=1 Tax=Phragmitibacter flavus TaxID=2576071 RepID=A0A5R8KEA9_9BACT|nr:nuclear transport factor 2 family protein [Phragmitibacter flavus]TLD69929.1 nuclear transport factor 2 family protein [Phragmitibacter flavus]
MKLNSFIYTAPLLSLICWFGLVTLHAESEPIVDELTSALLTADKERVDATLTADEARLNAILSDDLHYAHSSGVVDDKKVFVEALASKKSQYVTYAYRTQNFSYPAPGIALMTGQVDLKVKNAKGLNDMTLSYLAVWRLENGQWRFLAWQSCKLPGLEAKP